MEIKNIIYVLVGLIVVYFIYTYFSNKNESLLVTFQDAKKSNVISADKLPVINQVDYTYSIWTYVNDWNYKYGEKKVIYERLNENYPAPSLAFTPLTNDIEINITTYSTTQGNSTPVVNTYKVNNIPLQKWTNIILTLNNRALDVYIDGKLVKTFVLPGVPKVNALKDLQVTSANSTSSDSLAGFSGFISNLKVINKSVTPTQAYEIYKQGTSTSGIMDKYGVKMSFLKDNEEVSSIKL